MKTTKIDGPINTEPIDYSKFPQIDKEEYAERIQRLLDLASNQSIKKIIVYADREHFSNMEYLCGYDSRFEEALLLLEKSKLPQIIVALEGEDYSKIIPFEIKRHVYTGFGLQGQPSNNATLSNLLKICGLEKDDSIGLIGWKVYNQAEFPQGAIDIPYYIVHEIEKIVGIGNIAYITNLMTNNDYGLRSVLSENEIIQAEIANAEASRQVYDAICNIRTGMSEYEASLLFKLGGMPMNTYPTMNFGKQNVAMGLRSVDYTRNLKKGDIVSVGIGYRRAMIHRCAFFVKDETDLTETAGLKVIEFYQKYFALIKKWYENIAIGKTGGDVYSAITEEFNIHDMGIKLNMGHLIHTDEWMNSIFFENSEYTIKSGMAIQCDIIAGMQEPFASAHVEDGIIVADKGLQGRISKIAPESFDRILRRKQFMQNVLHINISDEVMPLSDIQGMLFLFMRDASVVLI